MGPLYSILHNTKKLYEKKTKNNRQRLQEKTLQHEILNCPARNLQLPSSRLWT